MPRACALTPRYAPPEQYCTDGEQSPWSDLYGLGATVYRCTAGEAPVDALQRGHAVGAGGADPQRCATAIGAGRYSSALLDAIDWSLGVRPQDRPQSASELLARLSGATSIRTSTIASFAYVPRRAERIHKIVFSGPVGAGKTTAIGALSDTPVLRTDEIATDMTRSRKDATTVALDFGVMKLSDTEKVHLYGTPGQFLSRDPGVEDYGV